MANLVLVCVSHRDCEVCLEKCGLPKVASKRRLDQVTFEAADSKVILQRVRNTISLLLSGCKRWFRIKVHYLVGAVARELGGEENREDR